MYLERFFPAVLRDYLYLHLEEPSPHMRPAPEYEARYLSAIQKLGSESVMTTPCVMHFLNKACSLLEDNEIYLEIGCYRGSTLIGALMGNAAHAIAVDDRSEPVHSDGLDDQDEFSRNIRRFGVHERVTFTKARYQDHYATAREREHPPAGVLFLDGFAQDADETLAMLEGAIPLLAPRALIVLDDANMAKVHMGVNAFIERHPDRARLLLHVLTPEILSHPKYPTWWNGLMAVAWRGGAP